MFFDTHAHITADCFSDVAINEMLDRAQSAKVTNILNINTDLITLERGIALSKKNSWVFNAAATTPHDVESEGELHFDRIAEAGRKGHLVAIGETGLDYHYEHSPRDLQKKFLIQYIDLAKSLHLPIIIHCRDAFEDLFKIFDIHYQNLPFILHCFTGTLEDAQNVVKRGGFVSFSGIITFKKSEALRDVAKNIPLENILVETDAPYLAPQSHRGKTNEPSFVLETAKCIASLHNLTLEEIAEFTSTNAFRALLLRK